MTRDRLAALLERLDRIARALETPAPAEAAPPPGRAFTWGGHRGFRAVARLAATDPTLFVGVERQQGALYEAVARFLAGRPSHDVLLWGDRGTGKSSLVRSLLRAFPDPRLALVEVAEGSLSDLPELLRCLEGDGRRWVVFLDDLSFGRPGDGYRELKVLLEGGLTARPDHALVVATSNRRHLVPERFPDPDEIHPEERVATEVSLADRFGLSLGFYPFDEPTYLEAVARHLAALGVDPPPEGWRGDAVRWALGKGIRSGRAALQAARELVGRGRTE